MKKSFLSSFLGISILMCMASCGAAKKTTQGPAGPIPFTAKIQDTLKFTDAQYKDLFFYNSTVIQMSGQFFGIGTFVDNGVAVIVDTTDMRSRTFEPLTQGSITGTIQKDPQSNIITSMYVKFTKRDGSMEFNFQFDLKGTVYVLNKSAKVFFEGKEYPILTYNEKTRESQPCILLFSLKRQHVTLSDQK